MHSVTKLSAICLQCFRKMLPMLNLVNEIGWPRIKAVDIRNTGPFPWRIKAARRIQRRVKLGNKWGLREVRPWASSILPDNQSCLGMFGAIERKVRNSFINLCLTACRELRAVRINPFVKAGSERQNPDRNMHLWCRHKAVTSFFELKSVYFVAQLSLVQFSGNPQRSETKKDIGISLLALGTSYFGHVFGILDVSDCIYNFVAVNLVFIMHLFY